MRVKTDYVLRQVADTWVVLPVGDCVADFNGMLTLKGSGVMLWHLLEQGATEDSLTDALTAKYDVSRDIAMEDVREFLSVLSRAGCFED